MQTDILMDGRSDKRNIAMVRPGRVSRCQVVGVCSGVVSGVAYLLKRPPADHSRRPSGVLHNCPRSPLPALPPLPSLPSDRRATVSRTESDYTSERSLAVRRYTGCSDLRINCAPKPNRPTTTTTAGHCE